MFRLLFKILLLSTALNLAFCHAIKAQSATNSSGIRAADTSHEEDSLNSSTSCTGNSEIIINIAADNEDDVQLLKAIHENDINAAIIFPQPYYFIACSTRPAFSNTLPIYIILHKYRV